MFKTFHGKFNNKNLNIETIHESPLIMLIPLILLGIGAVTSGFLFKDLFIGKDSVDLFWKSSIFFLEPLNSDHPPLWFIILTPLLITIAIPFGYLLFVKYSNIPKVIMENNKPLYIFLKNKWYFDEIYESTFIKPSKKLGLFFWKRIDGLIIDRFGPDGISKLIKIFSVIAVKFQSGFIYQYAFIMLLGFSLILTILIIR